MFSANAYYGFLVQEYSAMHQSSEIINYAFAQTIRCTFKIE